MSWRTCTDAELLNASRLYPPSNTETKRPSEYFSAIDNNSKVTHEKSSSCKFKLASGSSACASKPAETINKSGLNFLNPGKITSLKAVLNSEPPEPAESGAFIILLYSTMGFKKEFEIK